MLTCLVYGCPNNSISNTSLHFYFLPKNPQICQKWIRAAGWDAPLVNRKTARICSAHFEETCYTTECKVVDSVPCYTKILKFDAVPTLLLPHVETIDDSNMKEIVLLVTPDEEASNDLTTNRITSSPPPSSTITAKSLQEKYNQVKTQNQLRELIDQNHKLRSEISKMEKNIRTKKALLTSVMNNFGKQELKLKQLRYYDKHVKALPMSMMEQKRLMAKVFSASQIKLLTGKKKIYWSNDDMVVGFTLRQMSNKRFYLHLTKTLNIPFPAYSSIKRWLIAKRPPKISIEVKKKVEDDEDDNVEVLSE